MFRYILSFQFYTRIATPKWLVNLLNNLLFIINVAFHLYFKFIFFYYYYINTFFYPSNFYIFCGGFGGGGGIDIYSINNRKNSFCFSFLILTVFFVLCIDCILSQFHKNSDERIVRHNGEIGRKRERETERSEGKQQKKSKSFSQKRYSVTIWFHWTRLKWTPMSRKKTQNFKFWN